MKYEIGDKIKVIKIDIGAAASEDTLKELEKKYLGKEGEITYIDGSLPYPYAINFKEVENDSFNEEEIVGMDIQTIIE